MNDEEFVSDPGALHRAVDLLEQPGALHSMVDPISQLPETGIGSKAAMEQLAPRVLGAATRLGADTAFAHMDPPTPWITWAMSLWNASLNQNLLHAATGPVAREVEETVIRWLSPFFGMSGGHMTPGSTLANLTALWAARECSGVEEVIASASAHVSIAKAAHILGLRFIQLQVDRVGALARDALPRDLSKTALVLTAGTTSTGAIDDLALSGCAAWTHIDAAWGGPLRLTRYSGRLDGIEQADSVAVSAHKWLFQPKESALIFFRDTRTAHAAISFGGAYLASPNVGVLGSHGATAVPLLATLLAWGRAGIAKRIEHCVDLADQVAEYIATEERLVLLAQPQTGIVNWQPRNVEVLEATIERLPTGMVSTTSVGDRRWIRMVAANPNADVQRVISYIQAGVLDKRGCDLRN
jgi:L-2,4-diaminobutyrate decarboxylase